MSTEKPTERTEKVVEKIEKTEKQSRAPSMESTRAGLEQVREILFGAVYRDLEQRVSRADGHAAARIQDIEQESRRRTDVLEAHLRKETEALAGRFERQTTELTDAIKNLTREHRDATAEAERKIAKTEELNAAGLRDLRHQLLEQAKAFLDELQALRKEMLALFQRELGAEGETPEELDAIHATGSTH